MAFIEISNLTFEYPKSNKKALENISFSLNQGEIMLLMGRCGSGKSTLLRLMKNEIAPFGSVSGTIKCLSDKVGFVFQKPNDSIVCEDVQSELAFSLENSGLSDEVIKRKIGECCAFFGIENILNKKCSELSGGEKQLVSLASAMADMPSLLLLDEPTSQLDPASTEKFYNIVKRLNRELGTTVIISSHTPGDFFADANKVLVLKHGKAECFLPPSQVPNYLKSLNSDMLFALPIYTRLFDETPMSVGDSIKYASKLSEKPNCEIEEEKQYAVVAKNICFSYRKNSKDVLFRLNFSAPKGKIVAIVGVNGSGKSTLMGVLAGVKKPYHGKVICKGKTSLLPQNVSYLFTRDKVAEEILPDTAKKLHIENLLSSHPMDLSGGESRLLGLGMVLETGADIILLDEPTADIDAFSKIQFASILNDLKSCSKTIIMVTHDLNFAGQYADYISFLSQNSLTEPKPRREFFSSLSMYTTDVRRMTASTLNSAVSEDDLI